MDGIDGVVLAAGLSSRAGTNKMLLDMEGLTVIERCILSMYDICSKVIVVSGHRPSEIERILDGYSKVQVVHNANYLDGMFSSIKIGIEYVKGHRFFLIPGDYPAISEYVYEDMAKVDADIVIPIYEDRRGHPVLLKSFLIPELLSSDEYSNLREFIHSKDSTEFRVDDSGILMDIDTIEDYNRINLYFRGRRLSKEI